MRKTIKRLGAVLLAMAMAVSVLCTGALAAETTYSITVKPAVSGHTYEAYQVFTGTVATGEGKNKVLSDIQWSSDQNTTDNTTTLLNAVKAITVGESDKPFKSCTNAADVAAVLSKVTAKDNATIKAVAKVVAKYLDNILLVGDYYQHSVSARNNTGKPFKTPKGDVSYADFVDGVTKAGFEVDTTTLSRSRRCSADVCNFISSKLGIGIMSTGDHEGRVAWADDMANDVLRNNKITKLVYSEAARYSFSAVNWSYSKGDTMDCACVILTKDFEKLAEDDFSIKKISISTLNKLYVAMTRSRGDLYLIKSSTFKKLQDAYIRGQMCLVILAYVELLQKVELAPQVRSQFLRNC